MIFAVLREVADRRATGETKLDDPVRSLSAVGGSLGWILLFLFLNAFFVSAEFSFVKVRPYRVSELVERGDPRAKVLAHIISDVNRALSAAQLGITIASLGLGWLGEPFARDLLAPLFAWARVPEAWQGTLAVGAAFVLITSFHIVLGEQAPKVIGIRHAESIALWVAFPFYAFTWIMRPFIYLLDRATDGVLLLFRISPDQSQEIAHSEEELLSLMKQSEEQGILEAEEVALVDKVFTFTERTAREVMIPRTDMVCLYTSLPYEENVEIIRGTMHTRYPLCAPDKDHIVGFVHIKDFWRHPEERDLLRLARPVLKVPETIPLHRLLKRMQEEHVGIAILLDEFGGTSGLVTLEDILEEIVGEIQDEFDQERPEIEPLGEGRYSLDARLLVDEFNERFGASLPNEDYDTIGGFVYAHLEAVPNVGQTVVHGGFLFRVSEIEGERIVRVEVEPVFEPEDAAEERGKQEEGAEGDLSPSPRSADQA
ncbi:MAG: Magnesium and cobalt efflux protein CorC [Brockia lithotrophica]|uniref:Magnesium and cobalt efflux protein CorC n=1 Tax=Brockia lithotrophica TaxID=933949 RepID=A0A2T5G473_9BACL|nr:MAG: Magnesium and cobalt efflux protein CorC [Brockia lithotrophica]